MTGTLEAVVCVLRLSRIYQPENSWVWDSHQPGLAREGRAAEGCNRGPLCPALQKSQASCRNPSSSLPTPQVCCAGRGLSLLLLLLLFLPARPACQAPAVLPRAGEPLPARLEPAPPMAKSSPQPPAAASDIPLLCQAMKISPTGLEQPWQGERLANIPRKAPRGGSQHCQ